MAIVRRGGADYIGYEYKEKIVQKEKVSLVLDSYACFGWEMDPNSEYLGINTLSMGRVPLRFRRDRKICNRLELTRLQRNFDACMDEIERLERSKFSAATMWSLIVSLIGTAFIAGSVFAVTAAKPRILLCALLAIPGFIGWASAYFVYRSVLARESADLSPLIEEKYEEIHQVCEKGQRLLF